MTRLLIFCEFISGRHDFRLFTVLYFSVRSSRSRALRCGLPILHEFQNYPAERGISKRSHEKIGDCEQSSMICPLMRVESIFFDLF